MIIIQKTILICSALFLLIICSPWIVTILALELIKTVIESEKEPKKKEILESVKSVLKIYYPSFFIASLLST